MPGLEGSDYRRFDGLSGTVHGGKSRTQNGEEPGSEIGGKI
jgi:hypothetical protein